MGAADVVPGVSGGTIAFIMGVYERLIESIKRFDLVLARQLLSGQFRAAWEHVPWRFLLPLVGGIVIALLSLAQLVSWLLVAHPQYLFAFFFGLVLGSVVVIARELRWSATTLIAVIGGAALAWGVVGAVPAQAPHTPLVLFGSGAIAISAMILPGLSGSFILLILGQYAFMLNALKSLQVVTVLPFVAGMVVGIMVFARALSWLLHRYYQATVAMLLGLMIGALRRIWPWRETVSQQLDDNGQLVPLLERNVLPALDGSTFLALGLAIIGLLGVYWLQQLRQAGQG